MELEVRFRGSDGYALEMPLRGVGLNLVDKFREKENNMLELKRFSGFIEEIRKDVKISIDEQLARESNLFGEVNHVTVTVRDGLLNSYINIGWDTERNETTGEIKFVKFKYILDEDAVLQAWKEAGFPTEWEIEKKEENHELEGE